MATMYPTELTVVLSPVHNTGPVPIKIGINDKIEEISIDSVTVKNFEFLHNGAGKLHIELVNKTDQEAVIIEQVSFFGIQDPKFAWAGVYQPRYPEPWATEQRNQGLVLTPELCPHTYLGWPGIWTLTFDVPVFTWIHKIQGLGWIYD